MIGNVDNMWVFFSLILTVFITVIFLMFQKSFFDRIFLMIFNISLYVYSGYGIAGGFVRNKFYLYFFLFLFFINLSYSLVRRYFLIEKYKKNEKKQQFDNFMFNNKMLVLVIVLFYITLFLPLIFPTFRLSEIIMPPLASTQQLFEKRDMSDSNIFLYLGKTVQLLLLPFLYVYINKCIRQNKNFRWIILYALFVYLKFLEFGYLSRHEIVGYFALFVVMLMSTENFNKYRLFFFIGLLGLLFISVPFFVQYQQLRIGGTAVQNGYLDYFNTLMASEGYYPIYYEQSLSIQSLVSPISYFLWMFFLVVPSKILPIKPTLAINNIFTYHVTGLRYGDYLYSIQLPSILGESMILYGSYFFWFHAIFLGVLSATLFSIYEKYPILKFWLVYLAISFIKVPRGGSQGFISEALNGSLGLIAVYFIFLMVEMLRRRNNVKKD